LLGLFDYEVFFADGRKPNVIAAGNYNEMAEEIAVRW
jgi:hypothetical protein